MKPAKLAVVGATGLVGQTILQVLEQNDFPLASLRCLASARSAGKTLIFRGKEIEVEETSVECFQGVDLALFASTDAGAARYAPEAAVSGCTVIDNGSTFRLDENVPLVIPEVNAHALKNHQGIIANPNCSTIQMVMALKPIEDAFGLKEVFVSTYQSVSGWGKKATELFQNQARAYVQQKMLPEDTTVFPYPIFGNVIPHIDRFLESGITREEDKMIQETRKILEKDLLIAPICVRVPVLYAHAESLFVKTSQDTTSDDLREKIACFPGIKVLDDPATITYPTPKHATGRDDVLVGRIRKIQPHLFSLFVVADNLRKGAATNAIQIAEELLKMENTA